MVDMRLWWLRCRGSQKQFRYYWDAGSKNWADYSTKHHQDIYHEINTTICVFKTAFHETVTIDTGAHRR
jgi:hypothetical protein